MIIIIIINDNMHPSSPSSSATLKPKPSQAQKKQNFIFSTAPPSLCLAAAPTATFSRRQRRHHLVGTAAKERKLMRVPFPAHPRAPSSLQAVTTEETETRGVAGALEAGPSYRRSAVPPFRHRVASDSAPPLLAPPRVSASRLSMISSFEFAGNNDGTLTTWRLVRQRHGWAS